MNAQQDKSLRTIHWLNFTAIMSDFGYEIVSKNPNGPGILFRLRNDAVTEGYKNPVTVAEPDIPLSDGNYAYETDYVVDLLTMIVGSNGGKSILTILAKRNMH